MLSNAGSWEQKLSQRSRHRRGMEHLLLSKQHREGCLRTFKRSASDLNFLLRISLCGERSWHPVSVIGSASGKHAQQSSGFLIPLSLGWDASTSLNILQWDLPPSGFLCLLPAYFIDLQDLIHLSLQVHLLKTQSHKNVPPPSFIFWLPEKQKNMAKLW